MLYTAQRLWGTRKTPLNNGFSLVELSIVLVILGLLTGGILGGQELIRAAEMRAVTTEFQSFQTATNAFQDKYMALPGDFRKATLFWNQASDCLADGSGDNSTPGYLGGDALDGVCNGDGSGIIANYDDPDHFYEMFGFWQHLQLAGLINGQYTGVGGPNSTASHIQHQAPGENCPESKFGNAGWAIISEDPGHSYYFQMNYKNSLLFGGEATNNNPLITAVLTNEEAWNIDTKVDDGMPARGQVIAARWTCADADGNDDYDAVYDLDEDSVICGLIFRNGL